MTNKNPYLEALRKIPAGETRSFHELAALAGKPAAARAAGRAIAACAEDEPHPWHRIVGSDGSLAREAERASEQLERLRREGARPRDGESIARWASRRRATSVGDWRTRSFANKDDPRILKWVPERVEAFRAVDGAIARGFRPATAARAKSAPRGKRAALARKSGADGDDAPRPLRHEPRSAEVERRLADVEWSRVRGELTASGASIVPSLFDVPRCRVLRDMFEANELFERTIDMEPRGYGIGTYRYFKEPLPEPAYSVREELYTRLVDLARGARPDARSVELARGARSGLEYPRTLAEFFEQCRAAGQRRSSSILLSYASGGVNHPHRDIYGKLWFPYQAVLVLSARGEEFEGGDLLLCTRENGGSEVRRALPLDQGDLCVFASRGFETTEPAGPEVAAGARRGKKSGARITRAGTGVQPAKRWVEQTHGLSTVTRGTRFALGIVLHLAQ